MSRSTLLFSLVAPSPHSLALSTFPSLLNDHFFNFFLTLSLSFPPRLHLSLSLVPLRIISKRTGIKSLEIFSNKIWIPYNPRPNCVICKLLIDGLKKKLVAEFATLLLFLDFSLLLFWIPEKKLKLYCSKSLQKQTHLRIPRPHLRSHEPFVGSTNN